METTTSIGWTTGEGGETNGNTVNPGGGKTFGNPSKYQMFFSKHNKVSVNFIVGVLELQIKNNNSKSIMETQITV